MNATTTNLQLTDTIVNFVKLIKANAMGAQLVANFAVDNLKKGTAKNRSLAYDKFFDTEKQAWRTSKQTRYTNITFQRNYANSVNNRIDSEINVEPYIVEPPKGKAWLEGAEGILLYAINDPSKIYLRIAENKNTKRETIYFVDGKEATEEEINIIKEFSPTKNYTCKKQIEAGVEEDNQVIVKDITLTNIVSIKFGAKELKLR